MNQKPNDTAEAARQLADKTAAFMDGLIDQGWPEGAVMAGIHSGVMARMASKLGPEFAATASELAAQELRGIYNA